MTRTTTCWHDGGVIGEFHNPKALSAGAAARGAKPYDTEPPHQANTKK